MKDLAKVFAINAVGVLGIVAGLEAYSAFKDWQSNRKFRKELDSTEIPRGK